MGSSTISLGLGLGGGKAATSSGTSGGGAFSNTLSSSFNLDKLQTTYNFTSATTFTVSVWLKLDPGESNAHFVSNANII